MYIIFIYVCTAMHCIGKTRIGNTLAIRIQVPACRIQAGEYSITNKLFKLHVFITQIKQDFRISHETVIRFITLVILAYYYIQNTLAT